MIAAINDEKRYAADPPWKNSSTADYAYEERLRRIKFLRKHGETNPNASKVADRLESCEPEQRCLSGACPECGRLLQRWLGRRSKKFIAKNILHPKRELIGLILGDQSR